MFTEHLGSVTSHWLMAAVLSTGSTQIAHGPPEYPVSSQGIHLQVANVAETNRILIEAFGFRLERTSPDGLWRQYDAGARAYARVVVSPGPVHRDCGAREGAPRVELTLITKSLAKTIGAITSESDGLELDKSSVRMEQVGLAATVTDSSGNRYTLMELFRNVSDSNPGSSIGTSLIAGSPLYNYGVHLPLQEMRSSRRFWVEQLGLREATDRYLPSDLPLIDRNGDFALMLHFRPVILKTASAKRCSQIAIRLGASNPLALRQRLRNLPGLSTGDWSVDGFGQRFFSVSDSVGTPVQIFDAAPRDVERQN